VVGSLAREALRLIGAGDSSGAGGIVMGDPAGISTEQFLSPRRGSDVAAGGERLSIVRTTAAALAMPFRYPVELVRFGAVVFALSIANDVVLHYLSQVSVRYWWMMLSHVAIYTPLAIVWTRITVLGRKSVSTIGLYRYSAVEVRYLLASALVYIILLGPVLVIVQWALTAHQAGDSASANGLAVPAIVIIFVDLIVFVRLSFLFPAIALQRYRGIGAAWRQTHGNFERLLAIETAVLVPYIAIRMVGQHYWYVWFFTYDTWFSEALWHMMGAAILMLDFAGIVAAPSIAYKILVHGESTGALSPEPAGTAVS
jgi:hypothetical protein